MLFFNSERLVLLLNVSQCVSWLLLVNLCLQTCMPVCKLTRSLSPAQDDLTPSSKKIFARGNFPIRSPQSAKWDIPAHAASTCTTIPAPAITFIRRLRICPPRARKPFQVGRRHPPPSYREKVFICQTRLLRSTFEGEMRQRSLARKKSEVIR